MDRNRSADALLACATRCTSPLPDLPEVTSNIALSKPPLINFCSITLASRRLKSNSRWPRALVAPNALGVCPTSKMTRKADRSQVEPLAFCALPRGPARALWEPRGQTRPAETADRSVAMRTKQLIGIAPYAVSSSESMSAPHRGRFLGETAQACH